jgi:acetylglutamate kinase
VAVSGSTSFAGRWFVVKLGGELVFDTERLASGVGAAIRTLRAEGVKVLVVHGAGPQATQLAERLGLQARKIGGRRVTDEPTLEVMKMALGGQASIDLAAALRRAGVAAIATTGVSAALIEARRRPPVVVSGGGADPIDFGWVGDIASVNTPLLEQLAAIGLVLCLGSLAGDARGNVFNINADAVAARTASALGAAKLFLVSNVPGVLRDATDPRSRISALNAKEARAQIENGEIRGGMIPKVEEGLLALEAGVQSVHIVGREPPDALVLETAAPGSCGTVLRRD